MVQAMSALSGESRLTACARQFPLRRIRLECTDSGVEQLC